MDPKNPPMLKKLKKNIFDPYLDPLKMRFFLLVLRIFQGVRKTFFSSKMEQSLHSPWGVQFRKKCMKLKMFLKILAISVAHRKIDQFNISDHLKTHPSRQDRICSNPTGNSHGPLGVQFRKKRMKLKMFIMLLAINFAHRKIDQFNLVII